MYILYMCACMHDVYVCMCICVHVWLLAICFAIEPDIYMYSYSICQHCRYVGNTFLLLYSYIASYDIIDMHAFILSWCIYIRI